MECPAPEDLVLRLKHLTHAAFAQLACDLVMPERFADHEGTLQVDSRCNAMKSSSEAGAILAELNRD